MAKPTKKSVENFNIAHGNGILINRRKLKKLDTFNLDDVANTFDGLRKRRMAKDKQKRIYVLVHCPSEDCDPHKDWKVIQWLEHPALAPHSGGKRMVSTAAGDVELCVPPLAERDYKILGWASQRIEQLHPRPEMLSLEHMTDEALLNEVLKLSLEYVALAEDGRGHNARSRFIARQLREIQQHTVQPVSNESN